MNVLEDQRKRRFTPVTVACFAHRARRGVEEERTVIGLAVIVTRGAKSQRNPQKQKWEGEWKFQVEKFLQVGRIERREIRAVFIMLTHPNRPRRVDTERSQRQERQQRRDPPR